MADQLGPILPDWRVRDANPAGCKFGISFQNRDGVIAFAHLDVDFRNRLEPASITATLAALARRKAA